MAAIDFVEPVIFGLAMVSYIGYHGFLYSKYKRSPMSTAFGHNIKVKVKWAAFILAEKKEILGVQTLRNAMMASSLLATTSLTLSAVVAAYVLNSSKLHESGLNFLSSKFIPAVDKYFGVILCFSLSFFFYMQSVRAALHAGFMVSVPSESPQHVGLLLRRELIFSTIGTRIFYLAFLFVIWIFGPIPPVVLTGAMIVHLHHLDAVDEITGAAVTDECDNDFSVNV